MGAHLEGLMYNDENNMDSVSLASRDTNWLLLEVCREFQRSSCSRTAEECRYAHPPQHVNISNGRVIACFDFLKGRCSRENCKYLHAPPHLASSLTPAVTYPSPEILAKAAGVPTAYATLVMNAMQAAASLQLGTQTPLRPDKLEVCTEFLRGSCPLLNTSCRLAHPPDLKLIDPVDGRVTVCMDFVMARCMRPKCRYFHPPLHLQAMVKALHHQANQAAAAAANAATPTAAKSLKRPHDAAQNAEEEEEVVEEEQVEERKKRFGVVNESSAVAADDTET